MKKRYCKIFKNAKEGQSSFRVTSKLLESAYEKARKAKKKGMLVLAIPADNEYNYLIEGVITKVKK